MPCGPRQKVPSVPRLSRALHPALMTVQLGLESVSTFPRNRCPACPGISVHLRLESVSSLPRNPHTPLHNARAAPTEGYPIVRSPLGALIPLISTNLGIGTRPCKFNELQGFLLEDCPHATAKESRCSRFAYSRANRVVGRECASRRLANTTQFFALQNMK